MTSQRKVLSRCLVATIAVILVILTLLIWIDLPSYSAPTNVRPNVKAVLREYAWQGVAGGYWVDELIEQGKNVAKLEAMERVAFYKAILLNCKLETSTSLEFVEMLGDDAELLRIELVRSKQDPEFSRLSSIQQQRLVAWIEELRVVSDLRRQGLKPTY